MALARVSIKPIVCGWTSSETKNFLFFPFFFSCVCHRNLQFIVREKDQCESLNYQDVNYSENYLIGEYDIEILTLPRMFIEDVNVSQSQTTTIEIPNPGIATFLMKAPGYGSIYHVESKIR